MSTTVYAWNVNGLRAAARKGFLDWFRDTRPDALGVEETRTLPHELPPEIRQPDGYRTYWAPAERKGYSGVALYTAAEPHDVIVGLGRDEFDREGRTITAVYGDLVVIVAYFPNAGPKGRRLDYKLAYCDAFLEYCEQHRTAGRSVVFGGDLNIAHHESDLAQPDQNRDQPGFLPEERAWLDEVVAAGYVDTFRALHPDRTGAYTYWRPFANARERNLGWRIDYFFVSPDLMSHVVAAEIHPDVMGSDHCPVSVTLDLPLKATRPEADDLP